MKRFARFCATAVALVIYLMMGTLAGATRADVPTQQPRFSNPLNFTNIACFPQRR